MPISAAMLVVWCRPSTAVTRAIVFSRRRPRGVLARELSRGFSAFFAPFWVFLYALFGLFCAVRQCLWAPFLALLRIWPTLPLAEFWAFQFGNRSQFCVGVCFYQQELLPQKQDLGRYSVDTLGGVPRGAVRQAASPPMGCEAPRTFDFFGNPFWVYSRFFRD